MNYSDFKKMKSVLLLCFHYMGFNRSDHLGNRKFQLAFLSLTVYNFSDILPIYFVLCRCVCYCLYIVI